MVEVKVDSVETAMAVAKKKAGQDFGKLHVANSVTLGTRIRIDILRAIMNQFSEEGTTEMFATACTSRPVLHIKETRSQNQITSFALAFADAVARYGSRID